MNTLATAMTLLQEIELSPASQEEGTGSVMVFMFIIAGLIGIATWLFFLWGVKDRQFEDIEEVASRLNDMDAQNSTKA